MRPFCHHPASNSRNQHQVNNKGYWRRRLRGPTLTGGFDANGPHLTAARGTRMENLNGCGI